MEVVIVDSATLGPLVPAVFVRATLNALPPEEYRLESQQVLSYVAGNGPGTYRLEVKAEGYEDWMRNIRVGGRCGDTEMAHVVVRMTRRGGAE
ncbi:MAG: hypothetical protein HUU26_14105 [Gemmatimonadaceae bacterium]|nr:hypothetical protein [Gemmatimonadaceae bacterium]